MEQGLISVIVPVYNVFDYIDCCLETLAGQTYENLEIILINDGSTDGSLIKLLEWEKKDSRLRVIDQPNRGVSYSRNLGIAVSTGQYISFVDPDDWVELTYFEELMNALKENDADFAECDIYRYNNRTGKKIYRSCSSKMGIDFTKEEHMKYGPTATYKALSKKSLWAENGVRMPSCSFESPAVYSLVLALSKKTVNVKKALYYYRRFRENSLIETGYGKGGKSDPRLGIDAMHYLVKQFKRLGLYEQYEKTLEGVVKYRLSDILAMQFHRRDEEEFHELTEKMHEYLDEEFPGTMNFSYLTVGGYNLSKILTHMNLLHDPSNRYSFSSIITLLSEKEESVKPEHRNRYRKMMIEREFERGLEKAFSGRENEVIFMDLLEERFDLLKTENGYVTMSDAYGGMDNSNELNGKIIKRDSDEAFELFGRALDRLTELSEGSKIVMVENYLSEKTGNVKNQEYFDNVDEIRNTNLELKKLYAHVKKSHPEITVVEAADLPFYFTDEKYEYGAVPWHLNFPVNRQIAGRIESILKSEGLI